MVGSLSDAEPEEKSRLDVLRRRPQRMGYRINKTRWRHHTSDNWGGLAILDSYNNIVVGDRWSLTVDDAEEWLDKKAGA